MLCQCELSKEFPDLSRVLRSDSDVAQALISFDLEDNGKLLTGNPQPSSLSPSKPSSLVSPRRGPNVCMVQLPALNLSKASQALKHKI